MDETLILLKTSKGIEEIKHRSFGLPQSLRALLIMADGAISVSSLLGATSQFPQSEEHLNWLIQEGFIETTTGPRPVPSAAGSVRTNDLPPKQKLIAMTRELLGPDASKVLQRLEDVSESEPELLAAAERCYKFIKLTIDEKKADNFLATARSLIKSG